MKNIELQNLIEKYLISDSIKLDESKDNGKIVRPISIKRIVKKLKVNNLSTIEDFFLYNKYYDVVNIFKKITTTLNPGGMNPNKEFPPLEYFVENDVVKEYYSHFIRDEKPNWNTFYHIGNKGSGKTFSQDVFLHKYFNELEQKKIIFVRCDVHKLYEIWRKSIPFDNFNSNIITIEEYLNLQFAYVFCKYHKITNSFREIYKNIEIKNLSYPSILNLELSTFKDMSCAEAIIRNYNIIHAKENATLIKNYSYIVDEIMAGAITSTKRRALKAWESLSKSIQKFAIESGYKFLFIIDGIDNIDLSQSPENTKLYKKMLHLYKDFVNIAPFEGSFRIAGMRPRTINELNKLAFETTNLNFYNNDFKKIEQSKLDQTLLSSILKKRVDFCKSFILNTNSIYSEKILEIFNIVIDIDSNPVLDEYFHENCRNYLCNKINVCLYLFYRWYIDSQNGKYKTYNLNDNYFRLKHEAVILNGRFYFDSNEKNVASDLGYFCFNLFNSNFDNSISSLKDHNYLISLRILQLLLGEFLLNPNLENIINFLNDKFNYPQILIEHAIAKLREFGLIDSELHISQKDNKPEIFFKKNEKGKLVYRKLFSSFEIIYYYALDTFLPFYLIKEKKIDSHKEKSKDYTYYFSCIKTSLYFLKYLLRLEELDMKKNYGTLPAGQRKHFKLPIKNNINNYKSFIGDKFKYLKESEVNLLLNEFSIDSVNL